MSNHSAFFLAWCFALLAFAVGWFCGNKIEKQKRQINYLITASERNLKEIATCKHMVSMYKEQSNIQQKQIVDLTQDRDFYKLNFERLAAKFNKNI